MNTEPLPSFSGDTPRCAKCGNEGASTHYRATGRCIHGSGMEIGAHSNERLHRECLRCGYQWDEAIVSSQKAKEEA